MIANMGCGQDFLGEIRLDLEKTAAANIQGDIQQLPFRNQCFHEVYCISVLEHIPDWKKALKELCRVTEQKLIIEVPVNSDLRKTEFFRIFLPTPKNLKLLFSVRERARATFWQFKPEQLLKFMGHYGFKSHYKKKIQFYCGMPSRCWLIIGWRHS